MQLLIGLLEFVAVIYPDHVLPSSCVDVSSSAVQGLLLVECSISAFGLEKAKPTGVRFV